MAGDVVAPPSSLSPNCRHVGRIKGALDRASGILRHRPPVSGHMSHVKHSDATARLPLTLSYAQNLEDAHLEMMFADVQTGTYVDVGGGHPVADNVSFWFYLKGWSGLIVEPQAKLADAYRHIRPRDRVYQGLAGAVDSTVPFHQVEGLHGLSSMHRDAAERAEQFGAAFHTIDMPVRRLDRLIADAGLAAVDFLKIDVEGAEAQVLAGLDLGRVRPKVIVVEAVNPGNPDGQTGAWEASILAAGYTHCFFDNLNRFYVSDEARELAERLPDRPLAWDAVTHLWDHGRAVDNAAHADHALARVLVHGFMALLPGLDPKLIAAALQHGLAARKLVPQRNDSRETLPAAALAVLLGNAEWPRVGQQQSGSDESLDRNDLTALIQSDRFRAALGRIACFFDGGHIVE